MQLVEAVFALQLLLQSGLLEVGLLKQGLQGCDLVLQLLDVVFELRDHFLFFTEGVDLGLQVRDSSLQLFVIFGQGAFGHAQLVHHLDLAIELLLLVLQLLFLIFDEL